MATELDPAALLSELTGQEKKKSGPPWRFLLLLFLLALATFVLVRRLTKQTETASSAPATPLKSTPTPEARPAPAKPRPKIEEAEPATQEIKPETPATPNGKAQPADDLTKIEGIGPKISGLLQSAGIHTFQQLADTEVSRLQELLSEANLNMADPATWPQQASLAEAGDWSGLEQLQSELKAGRREAQG